MSTYSYAKSALRASCDAPDHQSIQTDACWSVFIIGWSSILTGTSLQSCQVCFWKFYVSEYKSIQFLFNMSTGRSLDRCAIKMRSCAADIWRLGMAFELCSRYGTWARSLWSNRRRWAGATVQDHFEGSSARPNYIYYIFYKLWFDVTWFDVIKNNVMQSNVLL